MRSSYQMICSRILDRALFVPLQRGVKLTIPHPPRLSASQAKDGCAYGLFYLKAENTYRSSLLGKYLQNKPDQAKS